MLHIPRFLVVTNTLSRVISVDAVTRLVVRRYTLDM